MYKISAHMRFSSDLFDEAELDELSPLAIKHFAEGVIDSLVGDYEGRLVFFIYGNRVVGFQEAVDHLTELMLEHGGGRHGFTCYVTLCLGREAETTAIVDIDHIEEE